MTLVTNASIMQEARNAADFDEDGDALPFDRRERRRRLSNTVSEMERLVERVDHDGWDSTGGHTLLDLAITCTLELMADMAYLREAMWKLQAKR